MPFVDKPKLRPGSKGPLKQKKKKKLPLVTGIILIVIAFFVGAFLGNYSRTGTFLNPGAIIGQEDGQPQEVNFSLFWDVYDTLTEKFIGRPLNNQNVLYGAIKGMVASLDDPYTAFLTPEETKEFEKEIVGTFEGIGIEIGIKNEDLTVIAPINGGPAEKEGIKAGDLILEIDGEPTENMTLNEAVNLIRGPAGTKVEITVKPYRQATLNKYIITRQKIEVPSVAFEMLDDKIAYVEINRFSDDTLEKFNQATNFVLDNDAEALILDLRNNPGGFMETSVDVASLFINEGIIVTERFKEGEEGQVYRADNNARLGSIPMVVLVNEGSASAAEIVAGALQDHRRATLVGMATFGKGSVQELSSLTDGSSMRVTVADWLTPSGKKIDDQGLTPDIAIENTDDDFQQGYDAQLNRAIELLKK